MEKYELLIVLAAQALGLSLMIFGPPALGRWLRRINRRNLRMGSRLPPEFFRHLKTW